MPDLIQESIKQLSDKKQVSKHIMGNLTTMEDFPDLPPLPDYTLTPLPYLLPPIPDKLLTVLLPFIGYWALSLLFHWIDTMDYFPQYRLHTPAEVLKRNRASRWEVVRDVIIQQVVQTIVGILLTLSEPEDFSGKEQYDLTVWARRIRIAQRSIPGLLSVAGVNAIGLGKSLAPDHPVLAGAILGGRYPSIQRLALEGADAAMTASGFARWEWSLAWTMYYIAVPAFQFAAGICVMDTWQYFLHRGMHMNKWAYSKSTFVNAIQILP